MAGRLKKCVCCGEKITAEEPAVPYKGRYAHQRCFNASIKAIHVDKQDKLKEKSEKKKKTPKPKTELKDGMSEEEFKEKKQYYDYIRQITGEQQLTAKIYAVSNGFLNQYPSFSYTSMYQTLVYLNEIIEKELNEDVVGLIPFYHNEAQNFYDSVLRIEEKNKDKDITDMYQEKVVRIKPQKRMVRQLDIESIGGIDEL
jgi:hypothetical protein